MSALAAIQRTSGAKWVIAARLIAAVPLVGIGVMHLTGSAPLKPILEAAGTPLPGVNAIVAPLVQIAAGVLLATGAFARMGGALAIGTMLAALHAHLTIEEWPNPDEPPLALPIVVLASALLVVIVGAGGFSFDRRVAREAAGSNHSS